MGYMDINTLSTSGKLASPTVLAAVPPDNIGSGDSILKGDIQFGPKRKRITYNRINHTLNHPSKHLFSGIKSRNTPKNNINSTKTDVIYIKSEQYLGCELLEID
jgi:hypothetical protein